MRRHHWCVCSAASHRVQTTLLLGALLSAASCSGTDSEKNTPSVADPSGESSTSTSTTESDWGFEDIADETVAHKTSVDLGPDGELHVVYVEEESGDLKHATNGAGDWDIEVIGSAAGGSASLSVDDDGGLHVAFASGDYRYTTRSAGRGDWTEETIEALAEGGEAVTSIDTNPEGTVVHVAYDDTDTTPRYARYEDATWTVGSVSQDPGTLANPSSLSVRADSVGAPHLAFQADELFYLSGDWQLTPLGGGPGDLGWKNSLLLDADDHPHVFDIAYDSDDKREFLEHHTSTGTTWKSRTLSHECNAGVAATFDGAGDAHFVCRDENGGLLYGAVTSDAAVTEVLPDVVGDAASIAVDDDTIHIVFLEHRGDDTVLVHGHRPLP